MVKARKAWKKKLFKPGPSKDSGGDSDNLLLGEDENAMSETDKCVEREKKVEAVIEEQTKTEEREDDDWEKNNLEIQVDIEIADQCFFRNDFEKAVELYNKVLKKISEKGNETSEIFGDINFKVSSILQGQSQLPLALNHLMIAKKTYRSCIDSEVGELDVLVAKLIEIVTGIANIYVDQGEIDNAAETYKDAVQICRELTNSDEKVAPVLMNYGNFLSVCKQDHIKAVDTLKEVLKIQLKTTGAMNSNSASTLNCMGKVYMRRSRASNSKQASRDAERAEACFLRALQIFRFSMVRSGNEKVIDTLYNLNEARERQTKKEGILRNVRFESSNFVNTEQHNINNMPSSASDSSSFGESDDDDDEEERSFIEVNNEKSDCHTDLGFSRIFNCGAVDYRDDK